jgi:hypothetical protein
MTEISENSADLYYERLSNSTNPGLVLAQFFGNVFDRTISRSEVILFNRLLKIYGRFIVYFTILDMSSMSELNFDNLYPLLSYFAKKRLDQKYGIIMVESQNLDKLANTYEKAIEKQKKTKLSIPELDNE